MNKSVFIVEDETDMLNLLDFILTKEGFEVFKFNKAEKALAEVESLMPDLVLLDVMLPDMSGLELCKKIKDNPKTSDIPVIILTSRNDEYDVILGFNFGCSDYITKPFNEKILTARIKATIEKSCKNCPCGKQNGIVKVGKLLIDLSKFEVSIKNKLVDLTPLEFKLLHFLTKNQNKVYTRQQLFRELYEDEDNRSDRAIDILINRIRKKIGSYGNNVESIYGVGYSFKNFKEQDSENCKAV
ncbi:MAG: response regulator transcription factor [bacterium]